jgi:hypothetical protein
MTLSVKFTTNLEAKARRASEAAARAVYAELNARFQDAIGTKAWSWPRSTVRSNGGIIPSGLRNIVDSSTLRSSNPGPQITGLSVTYRWGVNYAAAVHQGAMIRPWGNKSAAPVLLPARPWTSAVLGTVQVSGIEVYPLDRRFRQLWLARFMGS